MLHLLTLTAAADDHDRRLDRILRKALPDMPLSTIHRLLRKGRVLVDGLPSRAAARVKAGSVIQVPGTTGDEKDNTPKARAAGGAPEILWESPDLLVLNKPAGLTAHGPESLETLVRAYLAEKLPPSLSFKPGPLHRLDKPTSGIIVFSASLAGARYFSALLQERRVRKRYLALLEGTLETNETWEDPLVRDRERRKTFIDSGATARQARTRVFPQARAGGYTLVTLEIDTGRTHQIRAQAAAHGHPLAGDLKYGGRTLEGGFLLHAWVLELPEEIAVRGPLLPRRLEAPLPENFRRRIRELFGKIELTEAIENLLLPRTG